MYPNGQIMILDKSGRQAGWACDQVENGQVSQEENYKEQTHVCRWLKSNGEVSVTITRTEWGRGLYKRRTESFRKTHKNGEIVELTLLSNSTVSSSSNP